MVKEGLCKRYEGALLCSSLLRSVYDVCILVSSCRQSQLGSPQTPKKPEFLKVVLLLELLLKGGQLLNQAREGDSVVRQLFPGFAHQVVYLPNKDGC